LSYLNRIERRGDGEMGVGEIGRKKPAIAPCLF
jgi:hypothetical protein